MKSRSRLYQAILPAYPSGSGFDNVLFYCDETNDPDIDKNLQRLSLAYVGIATVLAQGLPANTSLVLQYLLPGQDPKVNENWVDVDEQSSDGRSMLQEIYWRGVRLVLRRVSPSPESTTLLSVGMTWTDC